MRLLLKVLANNSRDMHSCVSLVTPSQTYIFNMCDGLQRVALRNLKFLRVKNIFLSSLHHSAIGGLPGFVLTLKASQDGHLPLHKQTGSKPAQPPTKKKEGNKPYSDVNVFGPPGLTRVLNSVKALFPFGGLKPYEFQQEILTSASQGLSSDPFGQESKEEFKEIVHYQIPKMIFKKQEVSKYSDEDLEVQQIPLYSQDKKKLSICFLALGSRPAGRLDAAKAKALGVPSGKKLGLLKKGESVKLQDGSFVHPEQVLSQPEPAQGALILFIPSIDFLKSLLSSTELSPYFHENINRKERAINIIYHSCPVEVLQDPRYLHFVHKFSPDTLHMLDCRTPFEIHPRQQSIIHLAKLKSIYPSYFPKFLPISSSKGEKNWEGGPRLTGQSLYQLKQNLEGLNYKFVTGPIEIPLSLNQGVQFPVPQDLTAQIQKELAPVKAEFDQILKKQADQDLFTKVNTVSSDSTTLKPRLTFLGTQSMKPGILRNVSAIHLEVSVKDERRGIILDCGENTYGQMLDVWNEQIQEKLREIRLIYITHTHADHQIGVCRLLVQIQKAYQGVTDDWSVYLIYPTLMTPYVMHFSQLWLKNPERIKGLHSHLFNPQGSQYFYENALIAKNPNMYYKSIALESEEGGGQQSKEKQVDLAPAITKQEADSRVKALYEGGNDALKQFQAFIKTELGLKYFYAVQNDHMIESYAGILEFESGFKLSYSGDTRPCQNLINYANGSDILIHESTFGKDHDKDAICKKHSTNDEAIEVGVKSKVKHTILTHFSSRFDKMPEITKSMKENRGTVAFDYMSVEPEQLQNSKEFLTSLETITDLLFIKN